MSGDYLDPIASMKIKEPASTVLDFNGAFRKKRVEPVWEHPCGGQTFYLHEGGKIECARCHEFISKSWSDPTEKSP